MITAYLYHPNNSSYLTPTYAALAPSLRAALVCYSSSFISSPSSSYKLPLTAHLVRAIGSLAFMLSSLFLCGFWPTEPFLNLESTLRLRRRRASPYIYDKRGKRVLYFFFYVFFFSLLSRFASWVSSVPGLRFLLLFGTQEFGVLYHFSTFCFIFTFISALQQQKKSQASNSFRLCVLRLIYLDLMVDRLYECIHFLFNFTLTVTSTCLAS